MRKLLIIFALLIGSLTTCYAQQTMWFRTTKFAYKYLTEYGYWTDWSDWQPSSLSIKFDVERDLITIYSQERQVFKIVETLPAPYDNSGRQIMFRALDKDYNYANIRLRVEDSGSSQIYCDYNNISYVYVVVRTD